MEAISAYSFGSLAWLGLQALPLIVWPSFISSMLTPDFQHANDVEVYFARSLGFAQLAIGLMIVVLTGALPLTSMVETPTASMSPYASAVILLSTLYHGSGASYAYTHYHVSGEMGYALGSAGSAGLAAFGVWCLLFGGESARISKRTGADKRTSGFPFKNAEADKRKQR